MNATDRSKYLDSKSTVLLIVGLAVAYFISGRLGLLLAIPPGYATAVWPASGFALAALLRYGYRLWPGVFLGSFAVNVATSFDASSSDAVLQSLLLTSGIATGASLQALLGAYLVNRHVDMSTGLLETRDIITFYGLSGPVSCLVSASIGVTTLWSLGLVTPGEYPFSWANWWVGDTIGVLLIVPLLLSLFGEPREIWEDRGLRVVIPIVVTLTLAVGVFVISSHLEQQRIESRFRSQVVLIENFLEKELAKYTEALHSVHDHISFASALDRGRFRSIVSRVLQQNPGIKALSWNPIVSAKDRIQFEQAIQAEGFDDFTIRQRSSAGVLESAKNRDRYVVVNYIEPMADNLKAFGFDVYSNQSRRTALDKAAATGEMVATAPIKLVQELSTQAGFLAFQPVYKKDAILVSEDERKKSIKGYVVAVFRAGDLLATAMRKLQAENLIVRLFDKTNPSVISPLAYYRFENLGTRASLASHESEEAISLTEADSLPAGTLVDQIELEVGHRKWAFQVQSIPQYFTDQRTWVAWAVLAIALFFSSLLGLFLLIITGHTILNRIRADEFAEEVEHRLYAEQSLQQSQEKYRLAMQATQDGLWDWNIPSGTVFYSPSWARILGEETVENEYASWESRIHESDKKILLNTLQYHLNGDSPIWTEEHRLRRADGSYVWVLGRGQVVSRDVEGRPLRMVGTMTDITARKQTEVEQDRLHRELQQKRKMEALGQLTGGVAHDFNNILGIVMGYNKMVLSRYGDEVPEKVVEYVQTALSAAERAKELVAKMLTFSRKRQETVKPVQLALLLGENLQMLRSILPSSIEIDSYCEPGLPDVFMEPSQFQQLVMNLCINAKDAMGDVGTLLIELGWYRQANAECLACHRWVNGDWITLSVTDTGSGISDDVVDHLFEPFFTTKEVGKGTGLGMAVMHGIVSSIGGHVLLRTEEGKGTTFHVLFQSSGDSRVDEISEQTIDQIPNGQGRQVLVVDDERDLAAYLAEELELHGYIPTMLVDSDQALSLFKDDPQRFDLLITDHTMPGLTGMELAKKLREIRPDLPVILCTGYSDSVDAAEAEQHDVHFMSKPVDIDELLRSAGVYLGLSEQD